MSQNDEIEYERFRIVEGLLREIVANTAPAPEKAAKVETMADRIAADLKAGTFRGEQPAPPEPAKVECNPQNHVWSWGECKTCEPAQPEPAAPVEMPEAVREAANYLRQEARYEIEGGLERTVHGKKMRSRVLNDAADALECGWRTHAQYEEDEVAVFRRGYEQGKSDAAQPQRPKLEKVREILEVLHSKSVVQPNMSIGHYRKAYQDALAELDAAEGKEDYR